MATQQRVHRFAERSCSFAVDDTDVVNACGLTLGQINRHELSNLSRTKGVQVEHTIDRNADWLGFVPACLRFPSGSCAHACAPRPVDRRAQNFGVISAFVPGSMTMFSSSIGV